MKKHRTKIFRDQSFVRSIKQSQDDLSAAFLETIEQMTVLLESLNEKISRLENEEEKAWRLSGRSNGQHITPGEFFKGSVKNG